MSSIPVASNSEQPEERTIGGILVHPLALFTFFVGPAIVYAVSDNEFTRENARRALNWHVTVIALAAVASVIGFLGADEVTVGGEPIEPVALPAPIDTVLTFAGILLLLATAFAVLATFGYAIVATQKATSGSVWPYPGAIDIVGRFR